MNMQAVRILFLKDLFLSRRFLFAYFAAGLVASAIVCIPNQTFSFVGFILVMTVAIASGIHLIGTLMLSETTDQTKLFIMSMPISLLDYSVSKISVVLTTYLIPWASMFFSLLIVTYTMGKQGNVTVLPAIFLFLLSGFTLQLVTAVISESVGWTICVMVGCNVLLNVFMMQLFGNEDVKTMVENNVLSWPSFIVQVISIELVTILSALVIAFLFQTRKRDLI